MKTKGGIFRWLRAEMVLGVRRRGTRDAQGGQMPRKEFAVAGSCDRVTHIAVYVNILL
jgi:hypothetical protein